MTFFNSFQFLGFLVQKHSFPLRPTHVGHFFALSKEELLISGV